MTSDEALTVATICLTADGGCSDCGGNLLKQLADKFPEHRETFELAWAKEWPEYTPLIQESD